MKEEGIVLEKPLTDSELTELAKKEMDSICPICDTKNIINAIRIDYVTGILISTSFKSEVYLGCKDCLKNELMGSLSINLLSGWWSVLGLICTPFVILFNFLEYRKLNKSEPTRYFKEYIKELKDNDK